ncbi:MAG: NAD(P)-dependent oxidoreductase [Chloroflexi bacterium]|nr:NAD(P)-dependent oxidoreductase [Chloroflexota bacterium]MCL5076373.1 NAD(P)-dependent oxidoreductase [Chloroflexota bacterium]
MRVGFIGLGKMGRPMALNLLRANFSLTVHNRSRAVVEELVQMGASGAASAREVARGCDVVLTCLPNPATVEEVFLGPEGIISATREGHILIDHSTVGPSTSREIAAAAREKGAYFLDAPISGGPAGAQAGTLTIMVGGDKGAFDQVLPILQAMGKNIHHVGSVGNGSIVKLANQLLVGINLAGVVEAMVLGTRAGVDPQVMYDVLSTSFGSSAMLMRSVPLFLRRNFHPATSIGLICKDLGIVGELGKEQQVRLLLGSLAEQVFNEAKAMGLGDQDMAALVLPLERLANTEVRGPSL